ncbi:unnamed protein product [Somion occarium]|uniref:Uncharacterized protein n=1 Tax=Somion occarium TaxID=3059160 RepID=A0ABP1DL02_9APHY
MVSNNTTDEHQYHLEASVDTAARPPPPAYNASEGYRGKFPVFVKTQPGVSTVSYNLHRSYVESGRLRVINPEEYVTPLGYSGPYVVEGNDGTSQTSLPGTHSLDLVRPSIGGEMQWGSASMQTNLSSSLFPTHDLMDLTNSKVLRQAIPTDNLRRYNECFEAFAVISHTSSLEGGFPNKKPPSTTNPHPFTVHDVTKENWEHFLQEIQDVSEDTTGDKVINGIVDTMGHLLIPGLDAQIYCKRSSPIGYVINRWNQEFFHPRMMEVVLAHGNVCCTGPLNAVPADRTMDSKHGPDSPDGYISEEEKAPSIRDRVVFHEYRTSRRSFREDVRSENRRRERRSARRGLKQQLKKQWHDRREVWRDPGRLDDDKWRLVVAYKPAVLE